MRANDFHETIYFTCIFIIYIFLFYDSPRRFVLALLGLDDSFSPSEDTKPDWQPYIMTSLYIFELPSYPCCFCHTLHRPIILLIYENVGVASFFIPGGQNCLSRY